MKLFDKLFFGFKTTGFEEVMLPDRNTSQSVLSTSVINNLSFGISEESRSPYDGLIVKLRSLPYNKYIHELRKHVYKTPEAFTSRPYSTYAYITGKIKRGLIPSLDKYLLLLDVDSVKNCEKTIKWLNSRKIKHIVINSSPSHFWIIGDKIDTVENHTHLMEEIPGIDEKYTRCSRKQGVLLLRGFPKAGFIPKFNNSDRYSGKGLFEKWIIQFKSYWESEDLSEVANALFAEAL